MLDRLIKGVALFAAGAAVGAAGAMWLMSDSGKQVRENLQDLASRAKDKMQECYEQVKQEMEANDEQPTE